MPLNRKKILIIDDDPDMAFHMSDTLKTHRYQVSVAHTGPDAIEKSMQGDFDLVLVDIRMPFFSGLWFCDAFKHRPQTKSIPVIVVSGLAPEENMEKAYQVGASAYLKKPFRSEELIETINKVLT